MATELELRQSVVNVMKGWLGWSEANGKFKAIIDLYNTQHPLPRGYKVQYTDEWCATTVTAAGMKAGLETIIFGECSCSRMIELYKAKGRWMENDAYRPQIGDIIMYYWKDGANYATTDCTAAPNHVGIVSAVNGNTLTIIEGNKGEAVSTRSVKINGRYIRGYCLPDYASMATKAPTPQPEQEEPEVTQEQFNQMFNTCLAQLRAKPASDWAQDAWKKAQAAEVFDGTKPQDALTREQAALILDRLGLLK